MIIPQKERSINIAFSENYNWLRGEERVTFYFRNIKKKKLFHLAEHEYFIQKVFHIKRSLSKFNGWRGKQVSACPVLEPPQPCTVTGRFSGGLHIYWEVKCCDGNVWGGRLKAHKRVESYQLSEAMSCSNLWPWWWEIQQPPPPPSRPQQQPWRPRRLQRGE